MAIDTQIVESELSQSANDGSALLAIIGLERLLGRDNLKISIGDINKAVGLSKTLLKRFRSFLQASGFKPINLNLPNKSFNELRDLVVEGMDDAKLARVVGTVVDEELQVNLGLAINVALDFLNSRIPPALVRSKPSDFLAASFTRAWRTISNPLTIVDDLEMGCLSTDQIRILKAVYPSLYELFAASLMSVIVDEDNPEKPMEYRKLKQISVLLGQPLVPENLKGILSKSFDSKTEEPASKGTPDFASQMQTQSQKTELGAA